MSSHDRPLLSQPLQASDSTYHAATTVRCASGTCQREAVPVLPEIRRNVTSSTVFTTFRRRCIPTSERTSSALVVCALISSTSALASELQVAEAAAAVRRSQQLAAYGLRYVDNIAGWQSVWSQLARRSRLSLPDLVRIVRGESSADSRPNKALNPSTYSLLLQGYPHCAFMMRIATEGFRVRWLHQRPNQTQRPRNHRSAVTCSDRVASRIAAGEATGTYLVVDAERFDHRDVHGNVNGAFRHLRQHANDVGWMCGLLPQRHAGVVELSAPFDWTGSPAIYGVFCRAMSFLVGRESPASMAANATDPDPFFAYEWVDDHVLIEPNIGARCPSADDALQLAMLVILGPGAINESKLHVLVDDSRSTKLGTIYRSVDCVKTGHQARESVRAGRVHPIVAQYASQTATNSIGELTAYHPVPPRRTPILPASSRIMLPFVAPCFDQADRRRTGRSSVVQQHTPARNATWNPHATLWSPTGA
ncbi:hypothetical protein ON010_g4400 [Phytophthora cinnamomi]|nr:hypothetical protein ON010_g4400 [Phytophthora cinnamomi]